MVANNPAFWERAANTVDRLINDKGRSDLVMLRHTSIEYNPVTDEEVAGTPLSQVVKCVILPVSKGVVEAFDNRLEGGTLIESNMRLLKIVAKGLTFEPRAGDTVLDLEGASWTLLGSTPVNVAGIPLLFSATVKRG